MCSDLDNRIPLYAVGSVFTIHRQRPCNFLLNRKEINFLPPDQLLELLPPGLQPYRQRRRARTRIVATANIPLPNRRPTHLNTSAAPECPHAPSHGERAPIKSRRVPSIAISRAISHAPGDPRPPTQACIRKIRPSHTPSCLHETAPRTCQRSSTRRAGRAARVPNASPAVRG